MKLIIDVAKFEEIICKHCMMKGENICPFDDLLLCPTIRKLEEPANTLTDGEWNCVVCNIVGGQDKKLCGSMKDCNQVVEKLIKLQDSISELQKTNTKKKGEKKGDINDGN